MRRAPRRLVAALALLVVLSGCGSTSKLVDADPSTSTVPTASSPSTQPSTQPSTSGQGAAPTASGPGSDRPTGPTTGVVATGPTVGPTTGSSKPSGSASSPEDAPDPAQSAPKFTGQTVDGGTLTGDDLWAGSPAVLVFFTSWCQTCAQNQAELTALAKQYQGRVNFVGISADDNGADLGRYLAEHPVDYPVVSDPKRLVWRSYAVVEPPFVVVVKAGGELARGWPGLPFDDLRATLTEVTGS